MANRLAGNVIIVDSAAGNTFIVNTISNSTGQMSKFKVNSISFWSGDTSGVGRMILTETNTDNHIVSFGFLGTPTGHATQSTSFGNSQPLESLKMPVLVSGTAWIYLA
jgi:hypothetical protein